MNYTYYLNMCVNNCCIHFFEEKHDAVSADYA